MKKIAIGFLLLCLSLLLFPSCGKKEKPTNVAKLFETSIEKPIVVVVPSYNNERYVEKNLKSILHQKYTNFSVTYINDASQDETGKKVEEILRSEKNGEKVTLINREKNCGALKNIYDAVYMAPDEAIILIVDGDDWLLHEDVLSVVNRVYANTDVWMTYGTHLEYPSYLPGFCKKLVGNEMQGNFRQMKFIFSHLRTFYAALFKKIPLGDLQKEGKFLPVACDVAMMLPMAEMARSHLFFIQSPLYVYNTENQISDFRVRLKDQRDVDMWIRNIPQYQQLPSLFER